MSKKPYDAEEVIDALLDRWSTVRRERDAMRDAMEGMRETRDYAEKDAAMWKDAQAAAKAQAIESMAIVNALKDALGCYAGEIVGTVKELEASKRAAPTVEEMDRRMSIERVSMKYLADLRRVREAVARFSRAMSMREIDEAGDALRAIDKEPMP